MEIPLYSQSGETLKNISIDDGVFAIAFNDAVVHQALQAQLANARQGTSSTKERGEVAGSGRKLFKQKGTGNARAGDLRSPLRRGGGIIFGPKPRSYRQALPKKMRQLAIRCLLSAKAGAGELKVLEELSLAAPKTREMAAILAALEIGGSALVALTAPGDNEVKSARNLTGVKMIPAGQLNVADLMSHDKLVITEAALRQVEALWAPAKGRGEE